MSQNQRLAFFMEVQKHKDTPYRWGAKGPLRFDCSGLVTYCIHQVGGPDYRETYNAQRLFNEFQKLEADEKPRPGDLCFYGMNDQHITHVMVNMGDGTVFGATGGDSTTTDDVAAARRGACVKSRASVTYRPDFRGYRRLPLE